MSNFSSVIVNNNKKTINGYVCKILTIFRSILSIVKSKSFYDRILEAEGGQLTMGRPGVPRRLVTRSFQSPQTTYHCCKND